MFLCNSPKTDCFSNADFNQIPFLVEPASGLSSIPEMPVLRGSETVPEPTIVTLRCVNVNRFGENFPLYIFPYICRHSAFCMLNQP